MSLLHPRRWPGILFWLCSAVVIYLLLLALFTLWQIPPLSWGNALQTVREDAEAAVAGKRNDNMKGYQWATLNQINKEAYQAIIAAEDGRFYLHGGIDWDAIRLAAEKNWQRKTFSVGGSTIPQQTVKNVYLSNHRSLIRKYRELLGTYLLEAKLEKHEILEVYLNIIEFGPDIYGIHHAARYYFNKSPAQLTAREGAYLAVLMPAPKKYYYSIHQAKRMAPHHNRKYQRILRDMRRMGQLSEVRYRGYANQTFYGAPPLDKKVIDNLDQLDESPRDENGIGITPVDDAVELSQPDSESSDDNPQPGTMTDDTIPLQNTDIHSVPNTGNSDDTVIITDRTENTESAESASDTETTGSTTDAHTDLAEPAKPEQ